MTAQNSPKPSSTISQAQLLTFLADPRSYPHHPKKVDLIHTHISYVAVVPPYVYKVKKPVNLEFLDFSSLEKRHYYAQREIELNRRLCPEIYLDVVPISWRGERLTFGKGDPIVDYAVRMHKLEERYFLKNRLQRGEVGPEELNRLVTKLTHFYKAQPSSSEISQWGRKEKLKISTDENFHQTEAFIGQMLSRPTFKAMQWFTERFYEEKGMLLESRIQEDRIKDCHGDLHLEHIHITPKSVCIYDCIEFNDRFRFIDIANDLAFLAMDLDYNGRADLAHYFVAQMAKELNDPALFHLMDFYKCYRAYVRGKVESFRSSESEVSETEQAASRERAQQYFQLALHYAVIGSHPTALLIMGRIGTGKSVLAAKLAEELGLQCFSSDQVRKQLAGLPIFERSSKAIREWLYGDDMSERTYQRLLHMAEEQLSTGKSVLLDATFGRRKYRDWCREYFERLRVPYCFLEMNASDETIKQRLKEREEKTAVSSDAQIEDFTMLSRRYEPPTELRADQILTLETEGGLEDTLGKVYQRLIDRHLQYI